MRMQILMGAEKNALKLTEKHLKALRNFMPKEVKRQAVRLRNRVRLEIAAHARDRTGDLENSWQVEQVDKLTHIVFSLSPYARMRDKGGLIKPIRGKYLAIPLQKGLRGRSPRSISMLFPITTRNKRRLLVARAGKKIVPMYVLKESVVQFGWDYIEKARARWLKKATLLGIVSERKDISTD